MRSYVPFDFLTNVIFPISIRLNNPVLGVVGAFVGPVIGLLVAGDTRIKFVPLASSKKFSPRTISRRYDGWAGVAVDAVDFVNANGLGAFETVFSSFRRFDLYKMPFIFKNVCVDCVDTDGVVFTKLRPLRLNVFLQNYN